MSTVLTTACIFPAQRPRIAAWHARTPRQLRCRGVCHAERRTLLTSAGIVIVALPLATTLIKRGQDSQFVQEVLPGGADPDAANKEAKRQAAKSCEKGGTRVQVVETSLGLGVESKLLRHLALRFGSDSDQLFIKDGEFKEAHFGPGAGSFKKGFLNTGQGMVAASEYLEINEAGCTQRSVDECVKWCEQWADGKLYVTVGQNCWSMVGQFIESDPDLILPESVKFKEKQVNGWTELFAEAAQYKADKDDVELGVVWDRVMDEPSTLVPELFDLIKPESLQDLVPESVAQAAENIAQTKDAITSSIKSGDGFVERAAEQVELRVEAATKSLIDLPKDAASALDPGGDQ